MDEGKWGMEGCKTMFGWSGKYRSVDNQRSNNNDEKKNTLLFSQIKDTNSARYRYRYTAQERERELGKLVASFAISPKATTISTPSENFDQLRTLESNALTHCISNNDTQLRAHVFSCYVYFGHMKLSVQFSLM